MKIIAILGLLASFTLASPAAADFYGYQDRHGNTIYTDDLSKVPADRRSDVQTHKKTEAFQPPISIKAPSRPDISVEQTPGEKRLNEQRKLEALKRALDQEYAALLKENEEIKADQKAADTPERVKAVNQKAVRFNARFKAYKEKKGVYKSRLDAFYKGPETTENRNPD